MWQKILISFSLDVLHRKEFKISKHLNIFERVVEIYAPCLIQKKSKEFKRNIIRLNVIPRPSGPMCMIGRAW